MDTPSKNIRSTTGLRNKKYWLSVRRLRLSLKYRPEILKLLLKMRQCVRKKNLLLKNLTHQLKLMEQRKQSQVSTNKDGCFNNNAKQEEPNQVIKSQRDLFVVKTDTVTTESNAHENTTGVEVTYIDKNTSCEHKDKFCQTDMDNMLHNEKGNTCILLDHKKTELSEKLIMANSLTVDSGDKNYDSETSTAKKIIVNQTDFKKPDVEVFTQTEISFQDSKSIDISFNNIVKAKLKDNCSQTENTENCIENPVSNTKITTQAENKSLDWTCTENGDKDKSIAEQVKEVAQSAMQQSGMVYVESAGMYYDYKTGYYYNSELGLYYHTDTGCYYYYSDEQKTFVFHSYPDRSSEAQNKPIKPIRKSKIYKKKMKSDDIENLTKNFSQDEDNGEASKPKRRRLIKHRNKTDKVGKKSAANKNETNNKIENETKDEQNDNKEKEKLKVENNKQKSDQELEDGECSNSSDEMSDSISDESDASTATASDDESVARHHPPCMRVIVRETSLAKLKVGSLFLVTKDGGTVGREGEHHSILLKDYNVSRNHLDIKFNADKRIYTAIDLGSKNGTILNGVRMSESLEVSDAMEVVHGSTLQLGETKLLCHIHAGNDTCGHCEPGLIMEAEEKEKKVAYTRSCSVQMQHQLELARLKNKYAPPPLAILDTEYNDRAQARREKVGSSHHAEKTQSSDLDTAIAADNKGFKLLEKMGWSKGEGLGKESQGDTEPIPLISNEGKSGLGASPAPSGAPVVTSKLGPATLRLAARTKMLQPPAKAFQQPTEEDSE